MSEKNVYVYNIRVENVKMSVNDEEVKEVFVVPSPLFYSILSEIYIGLQSLYSEKENLINRIRWTKVMLSIGTEKGSITVNNVSYIVYSNNMNESFIMIDLASLNEKMFIKQILDLPDIPRLLILKKFKSGWKAFILLYDPF